MKKTIVILLIASLGFLGFTTSSHAERVSLEDAQKAAQGWIAFIIEQKGSWGGADAAFLEDIKELKQKGRTIGYFGKVHPTGFIILPLRKEFSPIKAYSAENDLDPDVETGMADLIKGRMSATVNGVEKKLGALDKIPSKALQSVLKTNHQNAWNCLMEDQGYTTSDIGTKDISTMNYQEGSYLLKSDWAQNYPYNVFTPHMGCDSGHTLGHALVGCVATAAAQIMRYWNWPPYGDWTAAQILLDEYDWPNMTDELGPSSSQAEIAAVAELCFEVGYTIGMDYGCDGSSADSEDMVMVYPLFRYSGNVDHVSRNTMLPAILWYESMKVQLNLNRPMQYRVPGTTVGHSVVVDGWQELTEFVPMERQYHMNYGYSNSQTAWYTLDESPYAGGGEEKTFNIYPSQSLGSTLSGTYEMDESFPYRYFDQDATGHSAVFQSGQFLQFLEGVTVTNTSTDGGTFRFKGDPIFGSTLLFTRGDQSKGIKINNGAIVLSQNASIKLH